MTYDAKNIAGVIIAGGQGSRLGYADKPLLQINGVPILTYLIDQITPQVGTLFLNVNRNAAAFAEFGLHIQPDCQGHGPLAGVLAGMEAAAECGLFHYLACFPGDTPEFPTDLVRTLWGALQQQNAEVAWLSTGGQLQPLFSLWRLSLMPEVRTAVSQGAFSPRHFIENRRHTLVCIDPLPYHFRNINDAETLAEVRRLRATGDSSSS
jgi:molybdenum cofactor guanylyltransferase